MPEHPLVSLSPEALADLKRIVVDEFGADYTDQEIEEMGFELACLFLGTSNLHAIADYFMLRIIESHSSALPFSGDEGNTDANAK